MDNQKDKKQYKQYKVKFMVIEEGVFRDSKESKCSIVIAESAIDAIKGVQDKFDIRKRSRPGNYKFLLQDVDII